MVLDLDALVAGRLAGLDFATGDCADGCAGPAALTLGAGG